MFNFLLFKINQLTFQYQLRVVLIHKEKKDVHVFLEIHVWTSMYVRIGIIDMKLLKKMDRKHDESSNDNIFI